MDLDDVLEFACNVTLRALPRAVGQELKGERVGMSSLCGAARRCQTTLSCCLTVMSVASGE